MEKRKYVKPTLSGEEFVPQIYCTNCSGDDFHGITYKFECNAGGGASGKIYQETNGIAGLQRSGNADKHITDGSINRYTSYSACDETHTVTIPASSKDNLDTYFPQGYFYRNSYGKEQIINVRIWTANNTDIHATTNTQTTNWEIAKS